MALASYGFLLGFYPLALLALELASNAPWARARQTILLAVSLLFCAAGGVASLGYLLASSLFTFAVSRWLIQRADADGSLRLPLALGITANVLGLTFFKYTPFLAETFGVWLPASPALPAFALPLGISFITFQQIAYLVDASRGVTREYDWLDYATFISFFPKLVAGPLADAKPLIEQARRPERGQERQRDLGLGATLLIAGLFKKVMLADELGECAEPIFATAANAAPLTSADAWVGALAYTLQIYFDFSGYSDMAIGAARTLGVRLPLNFDSPYQAINISDFWRRWHITLGRFLTRYLYTPMATPLTRWAFARGTRAGLLFIVTVATPTLLTFSIAGLWHGAGWTFVCFGALHGIYLCVHQGWRELRRTRIGKAPRSLLRGAVAWATTFLSVLVAFVFFRAGSVQEALRLLATMLGLGSALDSPQPLEMLTERRDLLLLAATAALAWLAPNTTHLLREHEPTLDRPRASAPLGAHWTWRPTSAAAWLTAILGIASIAALGEASGFIYYRF